MVPAPLKTMAKKSPRGWRQRIELGERGDDDTGMP